MYVVILCYTIYLNYKDKDLYWDFVEIYTKKISIKLFLLVCVESNSNRGCMIRRLASGKQMQRDESKRKTKST